MRTMSCKAVELGTLGVAIWLHTAEDPSPDEWGSGIQATRALKDARGANASSIRSVVVSDGGAPNTKQRHELTYDVFEGRPHKLSVMTNVLENPIKRGVATAISWLNPAFKAVPVKKWRDALRHADVEDHVLEILEHLRDLQ